MAWPSEHKVLGAVIADEIQLDCIRSNCSRSIGSERLPLVEAREADVWCIFDNTADGAATGNALDLIARL